MFTITWAAPVHAAYLECWYVQPSSKYGRDRPALLSALHPQMFLASLSFAYFAKALSGSYMKSTITQLERRFDVPSYLIGVIDGSFEIGELVPPLLRTEYCCLDAGSCLQLGFFFNRGVKSLEINQALVQAFKFNLYIIFIINRWMWNVSCILLYVSCFLLSRRLGFQWIYPTYVDYLSKTFAFWKPKN